jgi:ABC-type multidrug transport system permease subunit
MSFNPKVFSGIQEALFLALMLVTVVTLFYVNINIMYKVGIAVIVFTVIFLMTMATQIMQQQKDTNKQIAA